MIFAEKGLTVDIAIKATHVADLAKYIGERDMLKAVTGALLMAVEYFNIKGSMTETQAVQTAALWIEKYPLETFEDLLLCLKNAKIGKYGPVYNRIDGQTIFTWFGLYLDEKYERFEQLKKAEQQQYQEENSIFVELAAKVIQEKKPDKVVDGRLTFEKHFANFKNSLKYQTKKNLQSMRLYFEKENEKHMNNPFDCYLNEIDEAMKNCK